jgi:hypothetical protein
MTRLASIAKAGFYPTRSLPRHRLAHLTSAQLADLRRHCLPAHDPRGEEAFSYALMVADQAFDPRRPDANLRGFVRVVAYHHYLHLLHAERVHAIDTLDGPTLDDLQPRLVFSGSGRDYGNPAQLPWFPPDWLAGVLARLTDLKQSPHSSAGERRHARRAQLVLLDLVELVRADALDRWTRREVSELLWQRWNDHAGEEVAFSTFQITLTLLRRTVAAVLAVRAEANRRC